MKQWRGNTEYLTQTYRLMISIIEWLPLLLHLYNRKNHHKSQMYIITLKLNFELCLRLLFTRKYRWKPIRSCHLNIRLSMRRQKERSNCNLFIKIRFKVHSEEKNELDRIYSNRLTARWRCLLFACSP